ncbi:MAG: hypothetical protein ABMA13_00145 [Chthoniobacteraceae bacterium]
MNPELPKPAGSRREMLVSLVCGLAVLGFVIYGIMHMGGQQEISSTNTLTGKVVGRKFTPQKEEQLTIGRGGLKGAQLAGEYVFTVRVDSEDRTFEVPVDAATYEAVRDGANFTFMRPRSEQEKVYPTPAP